MRFALLAVGPRGDVQPMIALAVALRAAEHDVSVVTHGCYTNIAEEFNIPVVRLSIDMETLLTSPAGAFLRDARKSTAGLMFSFQRLIAPFYPGLGQECLAASSGADVVIGNPVSAILALTIVEKLGVRSIMSYWSPVYPTRVCPIGGIPEVPAWFGPAAGPFYWYASLSALAMQWFVQCRGVNRWRVAMGMRPLGLYGPLNQFLASTNLQAYSETFAPCPAAWPDHVHVTGFWTLPKPEGWMPSAALERFLAAGVPPVAVALGSMHRGPVKARMIVDALRHCGLRGVFTGAGSDLGPLAGNDMFYARSIPHDWLFERATAVVHHAGSGTLTRALLAGLASVTLPLTNDEPFWAKTLHEHGAATEPLTRRTLTVDRLARAIQTATTDAWMRERARELGSRIARENGVARAVEILGR